MRVLQLTYRVPFPPTDGGAIGIYNITKGLSENGCTIDLVAINTPKHAQPKDAMKQVVNKQVDVFVDTSISLFKLLGSVLFRKTPYNVERFISKDVEETLIDLLQENTYDFIQVEGAFVAHYITVIKQHCTAPILVRTHNIEYVIWQRLAINEKNPLKQWFYKHLAKRLKRFETTYYNLADGIAAITPEDQQRLNEMGVHKPISVIPAGVDLSASQVEFLIQQEVDSIFIISALDWEPNIEGLKWFLDNVWSVLITKKPSIRLHIAGKSTPEWLKNSNIPQATIHGFVDDAKMFKNAYQLMLVPLLSGGGMRVKIVEGLALGKCIISTTIGAEGINYTDQQNIVIADTPDEWIDRIIFYLENETARRAIESEAKKLAFEEYDNKAVTRKYIDLYNQVVKHG